MFIENFRRLAAVIYAHNEHTIYGRTRLQKTIRLLQRVGYPTDYIYSIYFYGPYSEGVASDLDLLECIDYVSEEVLSTDNENQLYKIISNENTLQDDTDPFKQKIQFMENADLVPLELAATYDAFLQMTGSKEDALLRLRTKKGSKCTEGNLDKAMHLLKELELPTE